MALWLSEVSREVEYPLVVCWNPCYICEKSARASEFWLLTAASQRASVSFVARVRCEPTHYSPVVRLESAQCQSSGNWYGVSSGSAQCGPVTCESWSWRDPSPDDENGTPFRAHASR
eukprot:1169213-Prymnesium_polylepis.1